MRGRWRRCSCMHPPGEQSALVSNAFRRWSWVSASRSPRIPGSAPRWRGIIPARDAQVATGPVTSARVPQSGAEPECGRHGQHRRDEGVGQGDEPLELPRRRRPTGPTVDAPREAEAVDGVVVEHVPGRGADGEAPSAVTAEQAVAPRPAGAVDAGADDVELVDGRREDRLPARHARRRMPRRLHEQHVHRPMAAQPHRAGGDAQQQRECRDERGDRGGETLHGPTPVDARTRRAELPAPGGGSRPSEWNDVVGGSVNHGVAYLVAAGELNDTLLDLRPATSPARRRARPRSSAASARPLSPR